jgi:multidrug resistance efflux pump
MFRRRPVAGGMIAGGATAAVVGHHAAKKQFESMQKAQAQQAQLNQAQAQAQAAQAQAAQMQAAQATSQSQGPKKDVVQELEKLANLKQQGILSEEEFQQMKARLLSSG